MKSKKQPDFYSCMEDICYAIEHSIAVNERCIIAYTVYGAWSSNLLSLLETNGLLRKEKSKKLGIPCYCESGPRLEVEYTPNMQPFIQCMDCGNIRDVLPQELEYYESSPLQLAKFFTNFIDDIDKPTTIIKDIAFFVGETNGSILVYLVSSLRSSNAKEILSKCSDHAQGAAFIIVSSSNSLLIQGYNLIHLAEKKLWLIGEKNLGIDSSFMENKFSKSSQKQEAANIKWRNDPKRKAEDKLLKYLEANISKWTGLNHIEISNKLSEDHKNILSYKVKVNKQQDLSSSRVKSIVKNFFKSRNEPQRIFGHKNYNLPV